MNDSEFDELMNTIFNGEDQAESARLLAAMFGTLPAPDANITDELVDAYLERYREVFSSTGFTDEEVGKFTYCTTLWLRLLAKGMNAMGDEAFTQAYVDLEFIFQKLYERLSGKSYSDKPEYHPQCSCPGCTSTREAAASEGSSEN